MCVVVNTFIKLMIENASIILVRFNATELRVIGNAIESILLKIVLLELTSSPITAIIEQFSLLSRLCKNLQINKNIMPVATPIVMPTIP